MLMALGPFRIALSTMALEQMEDRENVRIARMDRARSMPTKQFLGLGDRELELRATIYKEVLSPGGPTQVELMRLWMRSGRRLPLISRSGHFYGFYLIEELTGEKTHVLPNGTFQKITLTIKLTRAPAGVTVFGIPVF
ncbi:phage tail protein [Halocynthiibacter styelae]|uniref:Phage tail protein n=1 Tax=Halocynthiibacter styelae TaxID=2761955 RepID=A0A8J7LM49_9RHOB|nr:phage tail protein [Paenihalocynthiibacter styelae]MBI1495414.1 phage tail protein [Paenihalocynthiibacter styelae]